jgi:uncharacterized protein
MSCDPHFLAGIRLFNEREFFACHDELEEVWGATLGDEREFYQGLIHVAVALHHFEEGNLGGARKMYGSARRYLQPYAPQHAGIDLDLFLAELKDCFAELLGSTGEYPTGVTLDADRIPTISLGLSFVSTEVPT